MCTSHNLEQISLIIFHFFSTLTFLVVGSMNLPPLLQLSLYLSTAWSKASPSQIADYQDLISEQLSDPPVELLCCFQPDCSIHNDLLDGYADHIMDTLLNCAFRCLPCRSSSPRKVVGWNNTAGKLKEASIFWHKVWEEAGCPT